MILSMMNENSSAYDIIYLFNYGDFDFLIYLSFHCRIFCTVDRSTDTVWQYSQIRSIRMHLCLQEFKIGLRGAIVG